MCNVHPHIKCEVIGYKEATPLGVMYHIPVGTMLDHRPQNGDVLYIYRYLGTEAEIAAEDCLQKMCRECYPASYNVIDQRKATQ